MQTSRSRRHFLVATGSFLCAGLVRRAAAGPALTQDPFTLGVASGYPAPDSVALWTRLAPLPLAPGGGMPETPIAVRWELAEDEGFGRLAASGTAWAAPAEAHSVHVEASRLQPAREYWYRFHAGDATSIVGRTHTAPAPDAAPTRLRFTFASCQHWEHGYFGAYRHMLKDDPDFILHLGDYIYESTWGADPVRLHAAGEPFTLDDYRARHAEYRSDPDLRAAHAACPWFMVWDDHEVENDYADDRSENADRRRWFRQRRAAAYQAYYEHMPLRRGMRALGPDLRLHARASFGQLADLHLLDDRQYRSPQPCPTPGRGGSRLIEACAARLAPDATLLGSAQEGWLAAGLAQGKARWNLLAQQTLMAHADGKPGPGEVFYSDGWDGYPAARQRLLDTLVETRAANPVVLGGDVHSFWVTDLKRDFSDPKSATVASEFVTTSVTSYPPPEDRIKAVVAENPHIRFGTGVHRGYGRIEITTDRLTADLRALDDAKRADSGCRTLASWVVDDGRPGAAKA